MFTLHAVAAGSHDKLRRASWILMALIGLLVLMPAGAQAASEMPIPFNGQEADLVSGPGHSVWFSSSRSLGRTTVEIAPDTTTEREPSEASFGYFKGGSPVLISHSGPSLAEAVLGSDGDFWRLNGRDLDRTSPTGEETVLANRSPSDKGNERMISGPEGGLWFTTEERGPGIGRVSPAGVVSKVGIGISGEAGETTALAFGREGRLWFTTGDRLGSLSTTGPPRIHFVSIPHKAELGQSIAKGANGDLWTIGVLLRVPRPTYFASHLGEK